MTKVFWKDAEIEVIAERAGELITSGAEKSWTKAIIRVQGCLSKDRQKPESSIGAFAPKVREVFKHQQKEKAKAADSKVSAVTDLSEDKVMEPHLPKPPLDNMFSTQIVNVAHILAQRFEEELVAKLEMATTNALRTVETSFQKRIDAARAQVKELKVTLPKVLVVGVLGSQATELDKEYSSTLDMRYLDNTTGVALLKSQSSHSDYVILLTKFISHKHQEVVRDHKGLILVNGAVSAVKDVLLSIACEER